MASIISTGIGSGLDIAGIVQQLVAAEAQPVETRIGQQEARAQSKLSAFGSLKSALAAFRDTLDTTRDLDKFLLRKAESSDESLFEVSVGNNALPASYAIEIVQSAQAQKLNSGAFADSDTVVGTGTLQIAVGTENFSVEITDQNNTLAGIRDAINGAVDNTGVAATIVNADSGSYLILSGERTGAVNTMTVTQSGGDGGLASLEYDPGMGLNALTESVAAQDSLLRIDGLDVANESNTVVGAVEGVTINILQAAPGLRETLTVKNDTDATRNIVNDFVESYNNLVATFDQLTAFNADTKIAGPLLGDATLRNIRDQIRREFSTAVSDIDANFSSFPEVGIEVQLDGTLEIDADRLATTLAEDFSKFGQLFANTDGYGVRLFDLTERFLGNDGVLEARTEGLNSKIEEFDEQREALNERLVSLETRLLRQFSALDSLLGQLSTTSNFLTQQLANLPGIGRPGTNQ